LSALVCYNGVQLKGMVMDEYSKYIASSRYARWMDDDNRREFWPETVQRYVDYWSETLTKAESKEMFKNIEQCGVMPSMRAMMTAGKALDRDNVAGFNCSYLPIDHPRAFDELMYILLCGTGVGYSVERQYVEKLPPIPELNESAITIVVADSKVGWATAFKQLITYLYEGVTPSWDISKVRAAGERLKTFGGRASGPQPLVDLFVYTVEVFTKAQGRRLTDLEAHDICCKIAEVIVVGGVRRSALISLSNPSSNSMRDAKSGQWWLGEAHRALANNSACYTRKPDFSFFMKEMVALHESKAGERGVFNREAAQNIAARNGRRDATVDFGTNPCSEIILRPNQFCNLSEVVVRSDDTLDTLKYKVKWATVLGTLQSSLTNFRYLRPIWKRNTEEEALLGVSLTGIMDNKVMAGANESQLEGWLKELKDVAIQTNAKWAKRLGVRPSAAITCVKPSGTVSQLVNSASGIHPRFSPYYIRTVRADSKDPMAQYMVEAGFPYEVDVTKDTTLVFAFPIRSPIGSVCAEEMGALAQLRLWKTYAEHWCEHKPSITVYYSDDEFFDVCAWMWSNFDILSGIALLPRSEHTYAQAPYQQIEKADYEAAVASMPTFDWEALAAYEFEDTTTSSQELACVGTSCEFTGV